MKTARYFACLALVIGVSATAQGQPFRSTQQIKPQQPAAQTAQPLQNRVQPIPTQTQGNITGPNSFNGQVLPPMSNFNQFNNPLVNPYAMPMNPYATPMNPYVTTPIIAPNPYAPNVYNPNPYAPSLVNPAINPYQTPYPMTPFNNFGPYNQYPLNPLLPNNFAPVVGIGGR